MVAKTDAKNNSFQLKSGFHTRLAVRSHNDEIYKLPVEYFS